MNLNKLTQKSQEALSEAQNLAISRGHQEVDVEHLAVALLSQKVNGGTERLFIDGTGIFRAGEKADQRREGPDDAGSDG